MVRNDEQRVVGIYSGHNSSVAMIEDGTCKFAAQEERFTNVKNQGGVPIRGLSCLQRHFDLGRTVFVAWTGRDIIRYVWKKGEVERNFDPSTSFILDRVKGFVRRIGFVNEFLNDNRSKDLHKKLSDIFSDKTVRISRIDHHLCHASAAYFGWGKMDEKILVLTCDGAGDGLCATVNIGEGGEIRRIASVEAAYSVARLYALLTYIMGMVPLEHEYKIMGLAPYASGSREAHSIAQRLGQLFTFEPKNPMVWRTIGCPPMRYANKYFADFFQNKRFDHMAAGMQLFLEQFLTKWVSQCIRETGIRKVALSGGMFMNVKANQKIAEIRGLEGLFIFPSCGDESNAIGAAYYLYNAMLKRAPQPIGPLYLGDSFENEDVESALSEFRFRNKVTVATPADIEKSVAELLHKGKIVARFKGRMEFGARALGNRSILANPADPKVVRTINEMIKSRDFWMPFCPSVLGETSEKYFIKPLDIPAPYMIITFDSRKEKRDKMIAALHPYDYTGRPQEVYEDWNPTYYKLIKYFEELTGESIILNTSFNLHGEPIVHSPEDALRVFDVSDLQYLAIEDFLISKK